MKKKWVINDNVLVVGRVEHHYELCKNNSKTIGGGWWEIVGEDMYFYKSSTEFGSVTKEQFEQADKFPYTEGYKLHLSHALTLEQAIKEHLRSR